MPYDILVLGATGKCLVLELVTAHSSRVPLGYTGRLIVRYLYAHQRYRTSFTLAIAGRSQA